MCRARGTDYSKPAEEGMGECMAVSHASGKPGVWFGFGHLSNSGQLWTAALYSRRSRSRSRSRSSGCSMRGPMPMFRPVIQGTMTLSVGAGHSKERRVSPSQRESVCQLDKSRNQGRFPGSCKAEEEVRVLEVQHAHAMAGLCLSVVIGNIRDRETGSLPTAGLARTTKLPIWPRYLVMQFVSLCPSGESRVNPACQQRCRDSPKKWKTCSGREWNHWELCSGGCKRHHRKGRR